MTLTPIATFRSPLTTKFGIPRQSGLVTQLSGSIFLTPPYNNIDYIRGLEQFDYLWLIWGFSANRDVAIKPVVRPPRLGGNAKIGVFATRSPYRPNALGLSSVRLLSVDTNDSREVVLHVCGADLMDGTPIYDIKPYISYTDSHENVRCGFVDEHPMPLLTVTFADCCKNILLPDDMQTVSALLSHDPRPHYQHTDGRIYGMPYKYWDIRFTVDEQEGLVKVLEIARP